MRNTNTKLRVPGCHPNMGSERSWPAFSCSLCSVLFIHSATLSNSSFLVTFGILTRTVSPLPCRAQEEQITSRALAIPHSMLYVCNCWTPLQSLSPWKNLPEAQRSVCLRQLSQTNRLLEQSSLSTTHVQHCATPQGPLANTSAYIIFQHTAKSQLIFQRHSARAHTGCHQTIQTLTVRTSCIPTSLDIRSMSIIFTSNRSLQFSSCFSSFSAKSRTSNNRFVVDPKSTGQNSTRMVLEKAVSLVHLVFKPQCPCPEKFKVARELFLIAYFSSHRRSKAVHRFNRKPERVPHHHRH